MRRTPALAAWAGDRTRQRNGAMRAAEAADAVRALPALVAFRAALADLPDDEAAAADRIEAAVAALFAEESWPGELVRLLLAGAATDPFFNPAFGHSDNGLHAGLVVHEDSDVRISLGVGRLEPLAERKRSRTGPASVTFGGHRMVLRFLDAGGATLAFYALGPDRRTCAPAGKRRVHDGEMLAVDGGRHSWVIEHATGDILLLQAKILRDRALLALEFDADSLMPIGANTTDEGASRSMLLLSLIGAMGREDGAAAIERCLAAPEPFLRWHAMRELAGLDPERAMLPLMTMANADPVAEVRAAAAATLDLLRPVTPCHA